MTYGRLPSWNERFLRACAGARRRFQNGRSACPPSRPPLLRRSNAPRAEAGTAFARHAPPAEQAGG